MDIIEKEISLLKYLKEGEETAAQRDFAAKLGLSLGMTNTIIKRFAAKGWVMIKKITPKKFQYALTPEGLMELTKQSYKYLKKTMKSVAIYRETLEEMVKSIKDRGYSGITLKESSEVDFIIEALCIKAGLGFSKEDGGQNYFLLTLDTL